MLSNQIVGTDLGGRFPFYFVIFELKPTDINIIMMNNRKSIGAIKRKARKIKEAKEAKFLKRVSLTSNFFLKCNEELEEDPGAAC